MDTRFVAAKHLRRFTNIAKMKFDKKRQGVDTDTREEEEALRREFMSADYTDQELDILLSRVVTAAKNGEYEYEVMDFPASYCTDKGRAINNSEKSWADTLQGKARRFYEQWEKYGRPNGYHLKVKVLSYPDGFLGDVGMFLDWSE